MMAMFGYDSLSLKFQLEQVIGMVMVSLKMVKQKIYLLYVEGEPVRT